MTPLALLPEKAGPAVGWELIEEPSDPTMDCPDCRGWGEASYEADCYDRGSELHYTETRSGECQLCDGTGNLSPREICHHFTPADFDLRVDDDGTHWRRIR